MIPVAQPIITKRAHEYLHECLETGWVSGAGPFVEQFEQAFATAIGIKYSVATSSGTGALHLALASLSIEPGDEVIVPALTMIATVLPVLYLGATPVLVDVNEAGAIDPTLIEERITGRTRVIIPVHLHGHPAALAQIQAIGKRHNLRIVEDAAEAHGSTIHVDRKGVLGRMVGSIGDIGCFSFYGNKIVTTGEGGMAVTNSRRLAFRLKYLRNLARQGHTHFIHNDIGYPYRMSNLEAALGLAQLENFNRWIKKKRHIASLYQRLLATVPSVTFLKEPPHTKSIYWHVGVLLPDKKTRTRIAESLFRSGIETRPFVTPLHMQPALKKRGLFRGEHYPMAQKFARRGLCLPSGLALPDRDIYGICQCLKSALA